jgi:hypothetical protein
VPSVAPPKSGLFRLMHVLFSRYGCAPAGNAYPTRGNFSGYASVYTIKVEELLTRPHNPALFWVLDSLAAAAEAGRLDAEQYIEQLFASREDACVPPCPARSGRRPVAQRPPP